jgi:hypothetical protein
VRLWCSHNVIVVLLYTLLTPSVSVVFNYKHDTKYNDLQLYTTSVAIANSRQNTNTDKNTISVAEVACFRGVFRTLTTHKQHHLHKIYVKESHTQNTIQHKTNTISVVEMEKYTKKACPMAMDTLLITYEDTYCDMRVETGPILKFGCPPFCSQFIINANF